MENKNIFSKVKEPITIFLPSFCYETRQFRLFKTPELHALGKFIFKLSANCHIVSNCSIYYIKTFSLIKKKESIYQPLTIWESLDYSERDSELVE